MIIAAASGALIAGGLVGLVYALLPAPRPAPEIARPPRAGLARRARAAFVRMPRRTRILLGIGTTAGLAAWLLTGWPLLMIVGPVTTLGVPALLSNRVPAERIARLEAIQDWTRSLAGSLSTGKGLEDALKATASSAPAPIAPQVRLLAARLESRGDPRGALLAFADDLADPTGDMVAQSLATAMELRGPVVKVLDDLADDVADQVRARREVEANRATYRVTATWLTVITVGVVIVMLLNGTYIEPYRTPLGQLVFLVLASLFALTLFWFNRMSNGPGPGRLFTPARPTPAGAPATPGSRPQDAAGLSSGRLSAGPGGTS
ncbi:type II secretion system protein F (GspF) [Promicromonospora sp. AC04]|uniref:type II secretion system F family protein n=1 Tax=Promicromonospora sp. AC04 TaxID=2135723 RepID=UPI000D359606|nr:type II secretion system F family protein [Promicromonospora sp. AC04]PUB20853.1 type II secretion system protein F (GspF) [Promicromonospora sp. AC04]